MSAQVPCLDSDAMLLQLGPGPQAGIDIGDRCLEDQHLNRCNRQGIISSQRRPRHQLQLHQSTCLDIAAALFIIRLSLAFASGRHRERMESW